MHGLRIYPVIIEVLRLLRPIIALIARHDRDLTEQLRRAAASVALNAAEGSGSSGGTRQQRYRTALGSARETGACLDVALALGYLEKVEPEVLQKLDIVRATLARLVR
jgi:four helix bundle protein